MIKREVALLIFYNQKEQILLQNRQTISKAGEEWGFFGGALEGDETPEQALKREIKEEMNLNLAEIESPIEETRMSYFNYKQNQQVKLRRHIFVKEYNNEKFEVLEGVGAKWFDLNSAKKLRLVPGDLEVIEIVNSYLKEKDA